MSELAKEIEEYNQRLERYLLLNGISIASVTPSESWQNPPLVHEESDTPTVIKREDDDRD